MNTQFLRILLLMVISAGFLSDSIRAQQAPIYGGIGSTLAPSAQTAPGAISASLSAISSSSIFDGSTNISIPIHQFSLDNRQYGISLGYNTRGVKIDETVSPAGLHWNVFAEGSITRVIKDLPDELNIETIAEIGYEDTVFANKCRYMKGKMVTYTETPAQQAAANVYRDAESDDFVFACGGKSFTFNLAQDGKIFTHPHQNIKVTPLIDGVPIFLVEGQLVGNWGQFATSGILEFLVRDTDGTQYYFAKGDYQTIPLYTNEYDKEDPIGSAYATTRWVIKKVTFANGNEINYTYGQPELTYNLKYYKQYYAKETWTGTTPTTAAFLGDPHAEGALTTAQIMSIQYPNGTLAEFIYDATDRTELNLKMLNEIKISSGGQCLRYKLNRGKVNNRWFLNSVKLLSCDGTVEEPYYSFEYNPLTLPERFNGAQDYYGYYNGDSTGVGLNGTGISSGAGITIPQHNTSGSFTYGNTRTPNAAFAVAANLMKVKNAFGGEISFRYSGNTGSIPYTGSSVTLPSTSSYFMGEAATDGLRIDSIIEKERFHPENSKITVYEYSDGQIFMPGGYFHYPDFIDSATNHWDKVIFQSMFLTPHQFIGGANHGYSVVTEKSYTGTGELLAKKQTTFSNMRDEYSNYEVRYYKVGKHYFEYPYTDKQYLKDWEIGLPMKIVEYDQNNRIVKQTDNDYSFSLDNSASTYLTNTKRANVKSGYFIGFHFSGYTAATYYPNKKVITDTYSPFTGLALLRSAKVKTYVSDTRYVEDSTVYAYDARNNTKQITTRNSKGEKTNTVFVYNYDAGGTNVAGGAAPGSVLYNMTENGLEKVVSTERWEPGTGDVYGQKLLTSFINTFSYQGFVLKTKAMYDLKIDAPLSYTSYTGLSAANPNGNAYSKVIEAFQGATVPQYMEKSTEVNMADSKGNPLQTQLNSMNLYKSMIWDTTTGKKLAEAASAKYADIAFSGFESTVKGNLEYNATNIELSANVPSGGISGAHVLKAFNTTAPVTHPGLTPGKEYILSFWCTITPSFGGAGLGTIPVVNVYSPGNGWSLYNAKFTPANNSPVGFMTSGTPSTYYLDDVRIYPASATMQTYNYTPMFGISSVADENGRITSYEYDKLGRQTLVRDQQGNIISKTKYYNGAGL